MLRRLPCGWLTKTTKHFRGFPPWSHRGEGVHSACREQHREEKVGSSGVSKENAMNREEVNWLLQTIKDTKNAERFVLAQYERGRISAQVMADVARECGWINHRANRFLTMAAH